MSIVPMLIDHCSPTLASLKCGSLFSVTPEDMAYTRREAQALSDVLAPKGLAIRVIDVGDGRALCYLYRPGQLRCVLAGERERAFLAEQGYPDLHVEAAVDLLCARLAQGGAFPHEIGLFLGYPIDDVVAFIANKGRNCGGTSSTGSFPAAFICSFTCGIVFWNWLSIFGSTGTLSSITLPACCA